MSTYKQIAGTTVKAYTTNPSDPQEGEMWYNQTTLKLRGVTALAAFSSASPTTTSREGAGGFGIQTAAVIFGGETPPVTNLTEEYNGSGWTAGGNLNTARYRVAGAGTLTAGLAFGGFIPPNSNATEEYNGTSWTSGNNLNTARHSLGSGGTQTSALGFGGSVTGGTLYQSVTEEYNGTSWTEVSDLNTGRQQLSGAGANAEECLAFGGYTSSPPTVAVNNTESWDGTSWTEVNNLNTARYASDSGGTQTSAIMIGGFVGPGTVQNATETWDGTNWSTSPATLATSRSRSRGGGTSSAFVTATGQTPSITSATEEFNFSAQVVTAGAWATGGALNTARRSMNTGPIGTQDAGLSAGGYTTTRVAVTEEYNGTAWSNGNNTTDTLNNRGGAGSQTAGLLFGGLPSPTAVDDTEEYDGTNWTAGGALNTARGYGPIAAGTQTAALAAGGYNPPVTFVTSVEFYNGSTWATQPNTNQPNYAGASGGDQTAAWYVGAGAVSPAPPNKLTYNWDGTSWTSSGSYASSPVVNLFGGGPQTAGWMCGGDLDPGYSSSTNHYDGSVWSTAPTLGTARNYGGSGGTTTAGLIFGGFNGSNLSNTEEFTGETTSANTVDITTAE